MNGRAEGRGPAEEKEVAAAASCLRLLPCPWEAPSSGVDRGRLTQGWKPERLGRLSSALFRPPPPPAGADSISCLSLSQSLVRVPGLLSLSGCGHSLPGSRVGSELG